MKVQAFRLLNFMAFEDTDWIELRAITLLFGRNSSGKSALIRALLLLKQSLDALNQDSPLQFVAEGGLVDLNDFQTTVHRKPDERGEHLDLSLIFGFRCDLRGELELDAIRTLVHKNSVRPITAEELDHLATAELLIGFGCYEGTIKPDLLRLNMLVGNDTICLIECSRPNDRDFEQAYVLNSDVVDAEDLEEDAISISLRSTQGFWTTFASSLPASLNDLNEVDRILNYVQQGISAFLQQIVHVGPIRPLPERVYTLRHSDTARYQREGLLGWYRFLRDQIDQSDIDRIDKWVKELGLANDVRVEVDRDTKPIIRSSITLNEAVQVNLLDTGFGAGQVLPVIAVTVLAKPGSLVIIEQPELHLHTSAQIELSGLFIEAIESGASFWVESHSEHMLLRFQRMVAYAELKRKSKRSDSFFSRSKLTIIYISRDHHANRSQLEFIRLCQNGQTENASDEFTDFFNQDYEEVSEIMKISAQLSKFDQKGIDQ